MNKKIVSNWLHQACRACCAVVFFIFSMTAIAALTDLAAIPLSTSSGIAVRPNLMFVLDDSGSMAWSYMPDYIDDADTCKRAFTTHLSVSGFSRSGSTLTVTTSNNHGLSNGSGNYIYLSASTSGVSKLYQATRVSNDRFTVTSNVTPALANAYVSRVTSSACAEGTPPWYSAANNQAYYNPDIFYAPALNPNDLTTTLPSMSTWTAVRVNGLGLNSSGNQNSSTINIVSGYPEIVYCNSPVADTSSSNCRANTGLASASGNGYPYSYPERGGNFFGQFVAADLDQTTYLIPVVKNSNPHYYNIVPIEYCTDSSLRSCALQSSASGSHPTPSYVRFCNSTANATATSIGTANSSCQQKYSSTFRYPRYGRFSRVDIIPSVTNYPKAITRTDCAGTTCSYAEEMTNFANWYAYYRTRIQTMKTAAGRAFGTVDQSYRVGFITINPGDPVSANKYLMIDDFNASHKQSWYKKLYAASATGGTPLREALSRVGRHYGGLTNGINSGMTQDPVQYSCQQNFALLTTDGYWNGNAGVQLDGATAIGNQDNNPLDADSKRADGAFDGGDTTALGVTLPASDTLADVAMYYYKTDLRSSMTDNVAVSAKDKKSIQHMNTFTLGLGLEGELDYRSDYEQATSGDFAEIKQGTKNWPKPSADQPSTLDDLWHAAVNGRGLYFSAKDPNSLTSGLQGALAGVSARRGAASAAATSSANITEVDNFSFSSNYMSNYWFGELVAETIDTQTGEVNENSGWSAMTNLDSRVSANSESRNIYKFDGEGTGKVKAFIFENLSAEEKLWFSNKCNLLSQCPGLDSDAKAQANSGENMINFLRGQSGQTGNESHINKAYRERLHVLGDIVKSTPVYVKVPRFDYLDNVSPTYQEYKATQASTRNGMVYIGANDGMMHAFRAQDGVEAWAYIPKNVMPNLYKLADKNYGSNHQFYVDGSSRTFDVYDTTSNSWKTILVGSLNNGGRGYFALDITNESAPKALWEFCHTETYCALFDQDLGYSYGNAVIAKLPVGNANAGRWVVIVTSGYNNVSPGSGEGYVYILDAITGALIQKISTGVGTQATPSGLARISGWAVNGNFDAAVNYIYGGDLQGNLWKVNLTQPSATISRMARLTDPAGIGQPVSTAPQLGKVPNVSDPIVFVGTGKYLGTEDLADTQTQSFYAIRDNGTQYVGRSLAARTIVQDGLNATISGSAVDWAAGGWYVDFPGSKERVNVDPDLSLGTLTVATNSPANDACSIGGTGWKYAFDFSTGLMVRGATSSFGQKNQSGMIVGLTIIRLPGGQLKAIITDAGGNKTTVGVDVNSAGGVITRSGWREIAK
ncbi:pyrrolo-quinoline quinone [Methylobacillus gramineus]|uniref:pilus assembly protein n=1 Tax=Methylobacillus gramineus TaxID=755169 RepID=UPI001CFFB013|nr:PilC/PilY family type IV pilus protein [Methylobacillus gramineus]MCB5185944.1 pyrrolo-quinoline quinone [Methylobacillus gramineus]